MTELLRSLRKPQSDRQHDSHEDSKHSRYDDSVIRIIIKGLAICWMAAGLVVLLLMSAPFSMVHSHRALVQQAGGMGMYLVQRLGIELGCVLLLALPYLALWLVGLGLQHEPFTRHIQKLAVIQLAVHIVAGISFVVVMAFI